MGGVKVGRLSERFFILAFEKNFACMYYLWGFLVRSTVPVDASSEAVKFLLNQET